MSNFFGSSSSNNEATQAELGSRLYNIKQSSIGTESVLSILPDNNVVVNTCSSFGKSLLNVSSLNGLVGLLNTADSKVEVIDSGTGSIDFTLDNALKLSVKNAYTEVLNELRTMNVKPITDLGSDLGDSNKRYNTGFIRKITTNSVGQVSIGDGASTLGTSSVNIGNGSGGSGAPDFSVSIGRGANSEQSHTASICLGYASGQKGTVQKSGIIAIGHSAGTGISGVQGMNNNAIAIGSSSSLNGGGVDSVAIGAGANGNSVANDYSIAIGSGAGSAGQGNHCIAIGRLAGSSNQHNSTIIINGQNNTALNSDGTGRCFIAPIRSGGTGNVLNYDTGSKEVLSGGNVSMQTLTSQGLNPDLLNSRDIGTSSLPWNGVYCNGLIQPSASNAMSFNTNSSNRMFLNSSGRLILSTAVAGGAGSSNGGIMLFNGSSNNETRGVSAALLSNEIRGLHGASSDAGVLRIGAGGGSLTANHSYIDFEGFGTRCIKFNTGDGQRMIINGSGNCGINQSSPAERLDVVGNAKITGDILFDADNQRKLASNGSALKEVHCHTGFFKSIEVHSSTGGNIGTLSKPFDTIYLLNADIGNFVSNVKTYNLTPTANNTYTIGSSSSTQYNAIYGNNIYANGVSVSSDRRLKENIKPISNGLETVLKMKPVEYKMKDGVRLHTGFLADEMEHLYNNEDWACFVEQKDEVKTQSLQYMEVIAILAKAIQDLNCKVVKIENRKLVGGSVIDTSSLTEDFVQIYQRLEALESQPIRPTLHKCIEVSRFNEMYDRLTNLEARLSAFDELKDSEESELVHNLMEKNNQLELKVNELETKLNNLPKTEAKCNDFLESDGGLNMNELLQQKNFELETRLIKLEKQNKRLVQAVNKLLKSNDV